MQYENDNNQDRISYWFQNTKHVALNTTNIFCMKVFFIENSLKLKVEVPISLY